MNAKQLLLILHTLIMHVQHVHTPPSRELRLIYTHAQKGQLCIHGRGNKLLPLHCKGNPQTASNN